MIGAFTSLKSILSFNQIAIDNGVFVLHYKVTVLVLLVCTMLVSCKIHFGDPITCLADNNDVKFGRAVDQYCWIHSTYTVNELLEPQNGVRVLRPGVGPHTKATTPRFHKYYQWVGFFLLFQAWSFYFPRFLWKLWEGGRMERITLNLQNELNFREKELISRRRALANFLLKNFRRQNGYALRYFACEILNLLNVLVQILLTDLFLGHEFTKYGTEVVNFVFNDNGEMQPPRTDPMDRIFPKLSKCVFKQYGPSGNIIPHDILCVLPLNVLNEKVFCLLWFWFLILAAVSFTGILYRLVMFLPPVRRYRLEGKASLCDEMDLRIVSRHCSFGDWMVLYQLSKNIDPLIFADLMKDIAMSLKEKGVRATRHNYSTASLSDPYRRGSLITVKQQEPLYDCVPMEAHLS